MYNLFMKLEDTDLYQHLKTIDKDDIVTSILKNNIENYFVPLLNNIKIRMPEYTSHDEVHSINVLKNMWLIIPEKTKDVLSLVEVVLLIYSAYLHDIGMFIEDKDFNAIADSSEYQEYKYARMQEQEGNYNELDIIKDYIRINHGYRSELYIESIKDKFTIYGINYADILKRICCGHTLNIEKINDYCENSRIADNCVNEKYLTIILRIADLIDIYPNRTPSVLYEKIKPQNNFSVQEWQKHLSIKGWNINEKSIEIHAKCTEYNTERILRNFIKYINYEIKVCKDCLGYKNNEYILNLESNICADNIHSDGSYIYNELKFELNTTNIISLLMGNRLYSRPEYALRELLQNSIDAVLYRQKLEQNCSKDINFSPQISILYDNNFLTIEDNGIGMDINIFKKYFMNVGKSYYKSFEAMEKVKEFSSISEFGIGILSTFMIADQISVESKLRASNLNDKINPILVEIPTIDGYFIQKKSNKQEFGTKITLKLNKKNPFKTVNIEEFVKNCAPLIDNSIKITLNNKLIDMGVKSNSYNAAINLNMCEIYYTFDLNSSELGLVGKVFLIREQEDYVRCENVIAKNGFRIYCQNLIPSWANIKIVLNITNPNIKLSANRENFIINEDFEKLKEFIEKETENKIYEYLLDIKNKQTEDKYVQYVYELIKNKVLFNDTYRQKNKVIPKKIQDLILLPVIDANNNEQYKSVKDLMLFENIITFSRIPLRYKDQFSVPYAEIFDILAEYLPSNTLIINNSKINSYSTQVILSSMGLCVDKFISTSIKGFNIFLLSKNISKISYPLYWDNYLFSSDLYVKGNNNPLFMQLEPEEFVLGYPHKLFNIKHRLIKPYSNIKNINDSYISGEISKAFSDFVDNINASFSIYSFEYKKNNPSEIKKSYIDKLNISAKKLWSVYKKYSLITPKEKFKKLSEKDFPLALTIMF